MPSLDFHPSAAVRTRSPRKLADSRLNKHYVLVGTRRSDFRLDGWPMTYCPPSEHCRKPDHPFRAVNIDACFGPRLPLRDTAKAAAARRAGDCGRFAAPTTSLARQHAYEAQNGIQPMTARQRRRWWHKGRSVGEFV